ncbi:NUDIX domain-containing protein [Candidatus Bipolaricaulota bacterium]|nr:NUDIX domain-containing protein [Candidatus Bipolaricaulota bacterium]
MTQRYYIETDGRIFLVSRDGRLDLPIKSEIPFEFEIVAPLAPCSEVVFCVPNLTAHPSHWMSKDVVPVDPNVTPCVREAVHATMPRVVTEGVVVQNDSVLLLKGSRGLTKDLWTLPGGFIRFGEGPVDGLLREIREELRVDAEIEDLLAVHSKLGDHTLLHWTEFFYRVTLLGEVSPDPDEIAEARFFELDKGARLLADPLMREVIESLSAGRLRLE